MLLLRSSGTLVAGNFIGTDITGTLAIGNGTQGVEILGASGNTVGGTTAGARNIIAGNSQNGVLIQNAVAFFGLTAAADNNLIEGNYIGTQVNGTTALGNAADGVEIVYDASGDRRPGRRQQIGTAPPAPRPSPTPSTGFTSAAASTTRSVAPRLPRSTSSRAT